MSYTHLSAYDRGFDHSTAVFDLMCVPLSGGSCIDDLAVLRADDGLERLLGRAVLAPSTAHDYLRRLRYDGLALLFRVLGIPALVVKHARRLYVKLPRHHPHAAVFHAVSG